MRAVKDHRPAGKSSAAKASEFSKARGSSSGYADWEREPKQRVLWGRKLGLGFGTEHCGIGKVPWDLPRRGTQAIEGGSMKFPHTVRVLQKPWKVGFWGYLSSASQGWTVYKTWAWQHSLSLTREGNDPKRPVATAFLVRVSDQEIRGFLWRPKAITVINAFIPPLYHPSIYWRHPLF